MINIINPILPGFNADPSALRVGSDYYVVTSTFNWCNGVSLYHSTDLKNWRLVRNILDRLSQLDLRGNQDSTGVWAPQISYNSEEKKFYLTYTDVKSLSSSFFDLNNYVVYADNIEGPWSEPTYLNSSGFDPSIFHDDDGKSWLLNLAWEFRDNYPHPGPIIIQELDIKTLSLKSESKIIYTGNVKFGCTEGPHLYKRNDWYFLLTAEGGTGYGHAVKIARSRSVLGPYVESTNGPLITSRLNVDPDKPKPDSDFLKPQFYNPGAELQKSGHGSIIDTVDGEGVLFHLSAQPIMPQMRCVLNRETSIQKIEWVNDWPILISGDSKPKKHVSFNHSEGEYIDVTEPGTVNFNMKKLPENFYSLKNILDESWCSLSNKVGVLSLRGRNSPYSAHDLSLVSRRVQHLHCDILTTMDFEPENCRQMAGLVIQTGSMTFYYLRYYYSETLKSPALGLMVSLNGEKHEEARTVLPYSGEITLKISLSGSTISFYFSNNAIDFKRVGFDMDSTVLSDEFTNSGPGAFDGTFVGMTAHDFDRQKKWAEFSSFSYLPKI
ncbi:MAG: glycoside hydrolase family 43 protein [Spirochaetaceae bacterium]